MSSVFTFCLLQSELVEFLSKCGTVPYHYSCRLVDNKLSDLREEHITKKEPAPPDEKIEEDMVR